MLTVNRVALAALLIALVLAELASAHRARRAEEAAATGVPSLLASAAWD